MVSEISQLNIGSRPASRKASDRIEDLRAIPWVFSWAQCRLMLPGWYGFGTAVDSWLSSNPGAGNAAQDVPALAFLPHPALEHGHGTGENRSRHRFALCRTGDGPGTARHGVWPHSRGVGTYKKASAGDRGTGRVARRQPAAEALDAQPLSLHGPAQPSAGGTAAPPPMPANRANRPTNACAVAFTCRSTASRRDCATAARIAASNTIRDNDIMEPQVSARSVFYVSDGTGITAETLGHSLLTQFEGVRFKQARIPFVDTPEKAHAVIQRIEDAGRSDGQSRSCSRPWSIPNWRRWCTRPMRCACRSSKPSSPRWRRSWGQSTYSVGRSHGSIDTSDYKNRIEAINYTLAHDDGITDSDLEVADVILVGVSRCGKTPTSLYLAMQFGLKAANFPLIPEDFDRGRLPGTLEKHRAKLFGLTIQPERLAQIREERRPKSTYASLRNCRQEVHDAEKMMRREGIRWLDSSTKSIEEISTTVMQEVCLDNRVF